MVLCLIERDSCDSVYLPMMTDLSHVLLCFVVFVCCINLAVYFAVY